jgi:hypothetical protein
MQALNDRTDRLAIGISEACASLFTYSISDEDESRFVATKGVTLTGSSDNIGTVFSALLCAHGRLFNEMVYTKIRKMHIMLKSATPPASPALLLQSTKTTSVHEARLHSPATRL